MLKIFSIDDEEFTSNGDIVLNAVRAKVHKEDNGAFYLDIEAGLEYINYLVQGNIIVAPTPQGEQAFRIGNVEQTKSKIRLKAYHLFYDSQNYLIQDSRVVEKDCNYALDYFNSNTDNLSPFNTLSNITSINTLYCIRKSLYEAINEVLERWGGHLVRDNWNISIMDSIGQDNGVTIRYGKNLQDINCTYNWEDVVTKLLPVGKDGLMLPEVYLYSQTQYQIPYTKTYHLIKI